MGKHRCQGTMTVFFSILTILFLSLACSMAESVRIQGARVKAAAVLDMGIFSVFGEYERDLLEDYDVFGVDAALEGGFSMGNLEKRLDGYMKYNTKTEKLSIVTGNSLFPMNHEGSQIDQYLLLTDDNGRVFRDQAVQNWKSAFGTEILAEYLETTEQAGKLQEAGEQYEEQEANAEAQLEQAEAAEAAENASEEENPEEIVIVEPERPENPLDVIERIKNSGILGLVMQNPENVSQKTIETSSLPSHRTLEKGTMTWERSESGILEEGIFQEYLMEHFSCATDGEEEGALDYELEYLLAGKGSDQENLKTVVHKLLFLREGVNFLYVFSNTEMRRSAETLAAAISGGAPGITAALGAALLAAWAYGESLLDVRILLAGGKVPVVKNAQSFRLTLENLGKLPEVLEACNEAEGEGLDYRGYLQMLFLTGKKGSYPMRALDLMESSLKKQPGMEGFRVDHCVTGMQAEVHWELGTIFSWVPKAFLGEGLENIYYETTGRFIYECP